MNKVEYVLDIGFFLTPLCNSEIEPFLSDSMPSLKCKAPWITLLYAYRSLAEDEVLRVGMDTQEVKNVL